MKPICLMALMVLDGIHLNCLYGIFFLFTFKMAYRNMVVGVEFIVHTGMLIDSLPPNTSNTCVNIGKKILLCLKISTWTKNVGNLNNSIASL